MNRTATTLMALALLSTFAATAIAQPWYVKGDYYDGGTGIWTDNSGNVMLDPMADLRFVRDVTSDQAAGKHEFKIATADWSVSYPGCNSWVYTSGPGDVIHFTFDQNTYADGWYPSTNIIWNDHFAPPGTMFEVIGSAPETGSWSSGPPATLVGGTWTLDLLIALAGSYEAKFRAVGTWDVCNVGNETNTPCGGNIPYTTNNPGETVRFEFDTATGRTRAYVLIATPNVRGSWGKVKTLYR